MSANEKLVPYSIGSDRWPGLSKLVEEAGEVQQVVGKLLGTGGESAHWDGSDLRQRLQDEVADLIAACWFVVEVNQLDEDSMIERIGEKLEKFREWHGKPITYLRPDLPPEMLARGAERCGPNGDINNCAMANGDEEKNCQMCAGRCPDFARHAKPF